ncbi:DNA internalization-related competence protein ComEC/Rec2 [uncultured Gammaproteobacteria bacterium]|jgi:competence protein ComEC|nr:DNA internalization-related competence protein ComEC/Rec2 [uncultured Gammaproteobacteria bacterium]SSC10205.1 DNA internalization-related competence protein ComEC/Rec2 [thiotrophic endosymbiont of Bathymodiolus puteoserpentis (Logatchev)]CAC9647201.1 DNA internalization-related competence protein ComEC/Rec2 [uncultured Gammaproteobacteria bacterium]CAC9649957.1 DNA internalization-related competence protein ComEC/Rec2 [uncultured Gammaproteobacteria bacterium]CAC9996463.1 DNA internalizatio
MLIYALSFLLGIGLFSLKNTLQISPMEWVVIFAIFLTIFTTFKHHKPLSLNLAILVLGFAWMGVVSTQILSAKIQDNYLNKPILVRGEIVELPEKTSRSTKFIFKASSPFQGRLKLTWYSHYNNKTILAKVPNLRTGESWQLLLKLKHNNGYQNLNSFDYEKWLFYKRINATGYVRTSSDNQRINTDDGAFSIDKVRQDIRYLLSPQIEKKTFGGVINALIIGDRSLIPDAQWSLFKSTNTTHLSVISGLHIGLISGFVFLLVQFLWRYSARLSIMIPAQVIAAYFGLISALLYALISGFSIPTIRAFIMASVVFISIILRRHHDIWQLYGMALILVLLHNPLSVFSVGFWLSFYVVAIIIYGAGQHQEKSWLYRLIYIQLLISFSSLPLSIWFFSVTSALSPIANLIAIPIFSFIATPLSLISALLTFSGLTYLSEISFSIVNQSLVYLFVLLEQLQQFDFNQWHYTQTSLIDLALFILLVCVAILPKALKLRWLSVLVLGLMILIPNPKMDDNSVLITTLDVAQGLATVVQTKNHVLLFDTGAKYPSGFNLGGSVIAPYLRAKHIQYLDKIVISHGDNDHIGGLDNILENFKVGEILSSVPEKIQTKALTCQKGQSWQWDGIMFKMLNPEKETSFKGNNTSCVLKISNKKYSVLLTGDIERKAEHHLVQNNKEELKSTIMLAPHHGSKTSSTQAFLNAVSPSLIVVSSGFNNRFKHPAKTIIKRYQSNGIKVLKTSCSGQIDVLLSDTINIKEYRKESAYYYLRQCED